MAVMASRMLSRADLDALPDDGLRHELIDGAFVKMPAPSQLHDGDRRLAGIRHRTDPDPVGIGMITSTEKDARSLSASSPPHPAVLPRARSRHLQQPVLLWRRLVTTGDDYISPAASSAVRAADLEPLSTIL